MTERYVFKDSSNIRAATWNPLTRELRIDFSHGKSYPPVRNVSENTWKAFKAAPSPGAFVNRNFRDQGS